ncbi:MAG TPA: GIY-YIG nuclease family protein [Kiritimatiellia bacterium]|nr:GIY-YIG nuclease family protein [Kiritimatiellia bacterium]
MTGTLPYTVYILLSEKDGNFYVGFTTDLAKRLSDHTAGRVESTAPRRPFKLVHAEQYLSEADAIRREKYLKTTKGRRALRLMLRDAAGNSS